MKKTPTKLIHLPRKVAIKAVRGYQFVASPLLGPCCRFHPSCSHYAVEALHTHGALRGGWLTVKRIAKCGPFHPGGFDPVPGTETSSSDSCKDKQSCQQSQNMAHKERA